MAYDAPESMADPIVPKAHINNSKNKTIYLSHTCIPVHITKQQVPHKYAHNESVIYTCLQGCF